MGYNSRHVNEDCFIDGYNKTNNVPFKFKMMDKYQTARMMVVNGLSIENAKAILCISGRVSVKIGDQIEVLGKSLIVSDFGVKYDELQLKKRNDYDNIPSETVITLE